MARTFHRDEPHRRSVFVVDRVPGDNLLIGGEGGNYSLLVAENEHLHVPIAYLDVFDQFRRQTQRHWRRFAPTRRASMPSSPTSGCRA
jgi:hypothetical protein